MKLSEAIEHCLVTGVYSQSTPFMCVALKRASLGYLVHHVERLVGSIYPSSWDSTPLANALNNARIFKMEDNTEKASFDFNKQLYIWWVFDLKRKGM